MKLIALSLFLVLLPVGCASTGVAVTEPDTLKWVVVWSDDFEGANLDPSKWKPEESCWGGGNEERQCYTARSENVYVADGMLVLKAQAERFTGPNRPEGMRGAPAGKRTRNYTSGKVRTRGLADWTYGRFSARIRLPSGQGTWPAFWMMPSEAFYGGWPLSGEIDIMEATNLGTACDECDGGVERRTSGALHFGGRSPNNTYWFQKTAGDEDSSPADEFRVYSLEWAEGVMQWFVDGEIFLRLEADDWFTASEKAGQEADAPFDRPFYLMLNLAVGGNLAEKSNGGGFDPNAFPAELRVDWVTVEQCAGDATGRACLTEAEWDGTPMGPWETQAR